MKNSTVNPMTKPTLADFINRPFTAVRDGYKPDFMSIGAMMAAAVSFYSVKVVAGKFIDCIDCYVYELPKNLGIAVLNLVFFISIIPLFPIWWLVSYFAWNYKDKNND